MSNAMKNGKKEYEIILKARVRGLGNKGDVKNVARGYFRNFLQPRGMAVKYSEDELKAIQSMKTSENKEVSSVNWNEIIDKLTGKSIFLSREASGNGVLYSSVKKQNILEIINSDFNVNLDKNRIILTNVIKTLGHFVIKLDLEHQIFDMNLYLGRSIEDAKKIASEGKSE